MGPWKSSTHFTAFSTSSFQFLRSTWKPVFFVPTHTRRTPARTGAVKAGRRIGFLSPISLETIADNLRGFRKGLKETGYRTRGHHESARSFFATHAEQLASLTVRHSVPAIHQSRDFAIAGS